MTTTLTPEQLAQELSDALVAELAEEALYGEVQVALEPATHEAEATIVLHDESAMAERRGYAAFRRVESEFWDRAVLTPRFARVLVAADVNAKQCVHRSKRAA